MTPTRKQDRLGHTESTPSSGHWASGDRHGPQPCHGPLVVFGEPWRWILCSLEGSSVENSDSSMYNCLSLANKKASVWSQQKILGKEAHKAD